MSGVIEAIDGALHDWEISAGAMRWTPEPPERRSPSLTFRGINLLSHVTFHANVQPIHGGMRSTAAALADMAPAIELAGKARARFERAQRGPHQPAPLPINGHEYRRRQRHR